MLPFAVRPSVSAGPRGLAARCLKATDQLRWAYESEPPPFSLKKVLEHYGITEVRERLLNQDARLILEGRQLVIEVNRLFSKEHQRTSVAHEIGHIILNECSGRDRRAICHGLPREEALCDFIAGNLLVPSWGLESFLRESAGHGDWKGVVSCPLLLGAAEKFRVPVDLIARRIFEDLRWLSHRVAIVWRKCRDHSRSSQRALRVSSVWHSLPSSPDIPPSAIAPPASIIAEAIDRRGPLAAREDLNLGCLQGSFSVQAMAFVSPESPPAVLSLLAPGVRCAWA